MLEINSKNPKLPKMKRFEDFSQLTRVYKTSGARPTIQIWSKSDFLDF